MMMKKLICLLSFLSFTLGIFGTIPAQAAPGQETTTYSLSDLGLKEDAILHGPYDSSAIHFELPPTWNLQNGVELDLDISTYITLNNSASTNNTFTGAMLDVYFNDKLQQSIPLQAAANMIYQVPVSPEALLSTDKNGRDKISFFLDAAIDCNVDTHKTTVVISADSKALFPHTAGALKLDLRKLPWPIYQLSGIEKNTAVVVLPDTPSASELRSGLIVAGTLGRMTSGNLPVSLITHNQLTDAVKNESQVILVGKASAFSDLANSALTVPVSGGRYSFPNLKDDDGVLQAVVSPWNTSKVLLVVSGNTDSAVVKAAQALSTQNIQTGDTPDYSLIANVNPITTTGILASDLTTITAPDALFSDLGYESTTATGMGSNWFTYQFIIPPGQMPAEGPYVDIKYSISDQVDTNRSDGIVYLNNVLIGSLPLTAKDSNIVTSRIYLPASLLRSGVNEVDVEMNMLPQNECSVLAFSNLWTTIYADSVLHLPLTPTKATSAPLNQVKYYPLPFSNDPTLSTTAFVLSRADRASWSVAGSMAYDLGARVSGPILAFEAAYNDQLTDEVRASNLIMVGEPKNLPILSDLKNNMPAYFMAGSNTAVLDAQQVVYRISDSKKLGYLELFSSPWNVTSVILGVFGTGSDGVQFALNSLINPDLRSNLSGNFITLDADKAIVVDTRTGLGLGQFESKLGPLAVSTEAPVTSGASEADQAQQQVAKNRQIIVIGMFGVAILIVAVVVVAFWRTLRKA